VVETVIFPKVVKRLLTEKGASIERFGKCADEDYFEIVARKAG
jgi:hypothetical protein